MTIEQQIKSEWLRSADILRNRIDFMDSERQIKKSKAEYSGINYNCISSSSKSNSTEKKYDKIAECDETIAKLKKLLETTENEILCAISSVSDRVQREILIKFYIEHKTLKTISKELHYSISSIKEKRNQALNSLNIDLWTY